MIAAISAEGDAAADTSRLIEEQIIPEMESIEGVASVTSIGSIEESVRLRLMKKRLRI
ncbi:MAG: hypothetical protein V8S08_02510 [Lachnoclostridium sp.]